jgi:polyisoprenyl-phosphate glycosyltransferase
MLARGHSGNHPELSVVVPCFDEEEVIRQTYERLTRVLDVISLRDYELVFVDDGSRDGTLPILRALHAHDPRVRVLSFSRNFGHSCAVSAGIEHARGDAVVLIDADLQDPPEVIAEFVLAWRNGAKVAYGVRTVRGGESGFKRATAAVFYRFLNRLSDIRIPLDTGDFRLIDRVVVDALLTMPESDRFVRGLVAWVGFTQVSVPYARAPRAAGVTKYPLVKMIKFATTGVLSFSSAPLKLATWFGFFTAALSAVGIVYALYGRLVNNDTVPGWAATFIALLFFSGVQLITIGIIGEYIGRTFMQSKQRPNYIVAESLDRSGQAGND